MAKDRVLEVRTVTTIIILSKQKKNVYFEVDGLFPSTGKKMQENETACMGRQYNTMRVIFMTRMHVKRSTMAWHACCTGRSISGNPPFFFVGFDPMFWNCLLLI